jgi:hypothetical protein
MKAYLGIVILGHVHVWIMEWLGNRLEVKSLPLVPFCPEAASSGFGWGGYNWACKNLARSILGDASDDSFAKTEEDLFCAEVISKLTNPGFFFLPEANPHGGLDVVKWITSRVLEKALEGNGLTVVEQQFLLGKD